MTPFSVILKNGLFFDGTSAPGAIRNVGIREGRVAAVTAEPLPEDGCATVIDAQGQWVMPGFLDTHTHYDAELIAAPGLTESVRHGVTTVTVGSCSISAILSAPEDCSDLFTRVEAVPRAQVLPLLLKHKTWSSAQEYVTYLRGQPLGPNVTAFLGHSDLRVAVLGLERSVDGKARPTETEMRRMEQTLEQGLDAGLLGLSTMTLPWDKLDGDRFRSKSLPSTYATWREYRRLNRVLRRRDRIHQSAPNIVTKVNALLFLAESMGLFRKALKTTLITLSDAKSSPGLHRLVAFAANIFNRLFRADFKWQTLPVPFEVYADGIELVVFEEFGAGQAALHLANEVERNQLMQEESYRRQFRRDYDAKFTPRVWARDFYDAHIVNCPDTALEGKTFGEVADARKIHPVDAFLDLVVQYGKKLRWRMVIANHRPKEIERMINEPSAIISFSDAGAHIRNMAFYNNGLRMLKIIRDAELEGRPVVTLEKAVWKLTGEQADWFNVDAGHLRVGDRADVVVVNPTALDDRLSAYHEAPMEGLDGLVRMVNRSDGAVTATLVNGQVAFQDGAFNPALGQAAGFGTFLAAGSPRAAQPSPKIGSRHAPLQN